MKLFAFISLLALTIMFGPVPQQDGSPPEGLVLAFGFEEGSGTTTADSSPEGNNGTLEGGTSWTASGKYGNALEFNGTNSLVSVVDDDSLDLTTGMTLSCWLRPTNVSLSWRDAIMKGSDEYYMEATSNQTGSVPATGGTYVSAVYSPNSLPVNTWSYLTATYDSSTVRIYINGVEVKNQAETDPIGSSTGELTIGGDNLYGQWFTGRIDEVRIYNRALSVSEINDDMNTSIE